MSLAMLLLLAAAGETIAADGVRTVEITAPYGEIVVKAGDSKNVVVDGDASITKTDNRIVISGRGGIEAKVPKSWLVVRSQAGDVRIDGAYERVNVNTASGDVTLDVVGDEIEIRALSGAVKVTGQAKRLRVDAVSGDVDVDVKGLEDIRLQVTNGDIDIRADDLAERIEIESVNGDTKITGGLKKKASVRVRSMSGRIELVRKGGAGLRLEAQAKYGKIRVKGEKRKTDDLVIEDVDGGGADVRLTTFSGRISVD